MTSIAEFLKHCQRVIHVATLPRKKEFEMIVKISAIGIVMIGVLGALIAALLHLL
ncbi:MAG: protein translocase SEC61 complex subunit gamma [Candidatus Anstonellaceae archaeon]